MITDDFINILTRRLRAHHKIGQARANNHLEINAISVNIQTMLKASNITLEELKVKFH